MLLSRTVFVILLVLLPAVGWARSRSGSSVHVHGYTTRSGHYVAPYTRSAPHSSHPSAPASEHRSSSRLTSLSSHPSTIAAVGVTRDSHGRIKRSETAKQANVGAPWPRFAATGARHW